MSTASFQIGVFVLGAMVTESGIHAEVLSPKAGTTIRDFADIVCEIAPARQNLAEAFCQIDNNPGSVRANRPATLYPQLVSVRLEFLGLDENIRGYLQPRLTPCLFGGYSNHHEQQGAYKAT